MEGAHMSAAEALRLAHAAGVHVEIDGDGLSLEASAPPPPTVIDLLSLHKAEVAALLRQAEDEWSPEDWKIFFDERAGIIEFDGGAPRAWAEALARLDSNKPPGDVPPRRWLRFIDDCGRFLDGGWAARAAVLGWGPLDLFGCDRERPFARVDHLGLLWLLNGGTVVELHRNRAFLETERGAPQRYRRQPVEVGRVVLAWELSREAEVQ
jgi:hypothetical protein